jgi:hypothetical protein
VGCCFILLKVHILLLFFSEHLKQWFQNTVHVSRQVLCVLRGGGGGNYSPFTNPTQHTRFLVIEQAFVYCVGTFSAPITGILGSHKTTKMKPSFITHEKKHGINGSHGKIVTTNNKSLCMQLVLLESISGPMTLYKKYLKKKYALLHRVPNNP